MTEEKEEEKVEEKAEEQPAEEQPQQVEEATQILTTLVEKAKEKPTEAKPFPAKTRGPDNKIKYLNILDHGDTGAGKTQFCGTMIEAGLKVLYIVLNEDELLTLDQQGIKDYDYYVITNYEKQLWPLYLSLRRNAKGYQGVVFDGLGDFQQAAKDYELAGETGVGARFMEEAMKGHHRMAINNWGNLLEMTRHFLDPFLKLPLHKIVTCISEPDDDPKTGKAKIYPGLQGSLQQLIAAHFSVIGYSYVAFWGADTHYCLTTQPHESISTKDRTRLCRVMINPKFQTFLDALDGKPYPPGKKTEREDKLQKALIVRPQATTVKIEPKEKD